jgi:hypothetical protein
VNKATNAKIEFKDAKVSKGLALVTAPQNAGADEMSSLIDSDLK